MVECVDVENIEAAPVLHQHIREAHSSDDGVNDKREMVWTRNVSWVVLAAKGVGDLRPVKSPQRRPAHHVDPL